MWKMSGGFFGENDQDNVFDMPLRTGQIRYPELNDYFITARARPGKRKKLVPSLPSAVPAWALGAGFAVSVAAGIFFGVWPAVKAAQLDPVEALRYE